jgi:predicted DNA-binding protein (MmcQ/YjbR family)
MSGGPSPKRLSSQLDRMRSLALALPESTEELTWGTEVNFRVRKKIFLFPGDGGSLCVKAERDELIRTSYCLIAPKTLARQVEATSSPNSGSPR